MASIDEMINLARAQQRPSVISQLGEAANSAIGAFGQGVQMKNAMDMHRLQIAKAMLEMQQMQRAAMEDQAWDQRLGIGYKDATANGVNTDPTPLGKLNDFAPKPPATPTAAPVGPQMASAGVSDAPAPAGMPPTAGTSPVAPAPVAPPTATPSAPGIRGLNLPADMELTRENGHYKTTIKGREDFAPDAAAMAVLGTTATPEQLSTLSAHLSTMFPDGKVPHEYVSNLTTSNDAAMGRDIARTNHLDTLETNVRQSLNSMKGDPSLQRVENQRDAAISAYNRLNELESKGQLPNPVDYIDILGQIYRARTNSAPPEQVMKDLAQPTGTAQFNKAWTFFTGKQAPATTADIAGSLKELAASMGQQADKLHEGYMKDRLIKPSDLPAERFDPYTREARGTSFADATGYKPTSGPPGGSAQPTKVIGGQTFVNIGGKWYLQ